MAILDSLTAEILVNGKILPEYDDDDQQHVPSLRTVTKYVEVPTGEEFCVRVSTSAGYHRDVEGLGVNLFIDGKIRATGLLMVKEQHDDVATFGGVMISNNDQVTELRPFTFANINFVNASRNLSSNRMSYEDFRELGTVMVKVYRVKNISERSLGRLENYSHNDEPFKTRSKKLKPEGITQCVILGPPRRCTTPKSYDTRYERLADCYIQTEVPYQSLVVEIVKRIELDAEEHLDSVAERPSTSTEPPEPVSRAASPSTDAPEPVAKVSKSDDSEDYESNDPESSGRRQKGKGRMVTGIEEDGIDVMPTKPNHPTTRSLTRLQHSHSPPEPVPKRKRNATSNEEDSGMEENVEDNEELDDGSVDVGNSPSKRIRKKIDGGQSSSSYKSKQAMFPNLLSKGSSTSSAPGRVPSRQHGKGRYHPYARLGRSSNSVEAPEPVPKRRRGTKKTGSIDDDDENENENDEE
ncbi:MAG: hypothetical protein Q9209_003943 [Squamulea sp. 1 TL-2023]